MRKHPSPWVVFLFDEEGVAMARKEFRFKEFANGFAISSGRPFQIYMHETLIIKYDPNRNVDHDTPYLGPAGKYFKGCTFEGGSNGC